MRLYLPTTLRALAHPGPLRPAGAHALTPDLAAALSGEDEEALEFAALLAAADDSVALLARDDDAPRRRVVVVADLPGVRCERRSDAQPSSVEPPALVPWSAVVSLHVDEAEAGPDVAAAARGDADALDRVAERDLLWYDASELDAVRSFGGVGSSGDDREG